MSATAPSWSGPRRILLVEDIELNRILTEAVLRAGTYEVESVGNGEAAIAAIEAHAYDLVLMDIDLPGRDGHESTIVIRQKQANALKVAALSSRNEEDARARSRAVGMAAHIDRPIAPRDLLCEVDRLFREVPDAADEWDRSRYDEWVERLGAERMRGVLRTLLEQFRALLDRLPELGAETCDAIHRRAHDVASTSGMLGFAGVTNGCRAMLEATDATAETSARLILTDLLTRASAELDAFLSQQRNAT